MPEDRLTHIDSKGAARMVDVSAKKDTVRTATARATVLMAPSTARMILSGDVPKGDVLATARVAGIMAAKKTPDIIPMCHPLNLSSVKVDLRALKTRGRVDITATAKCKGPTGVEMEALTAAAAAALTIYDMCKAVDREMTITDVVLTEKKGGKSGHFRRKAAPRKKR